MITFALNTITIDWAALFPPPPLHFPTHGQHQRLKSDNKKNWHLLSKFIITLA